MVISQFIVAIVGVTAGRTDLGNSSAISAMIAFICINISMFAMTWGPSAWVIVGKWSSFVRGYLESPTSKGEALC